MPQPPTVFPNVVPPALTDGFPYSTAQPVPAAENDLGTPQDNQYGQAALCVIALRTQGAVLSQSTYVVLQTRDADGNWIDVGWITWTDLGSAVFVISTSAISERNAFQFTRATGQAPSPPIGTNAMGLGGQLRVVGKSTVNTSSSSSSLSSGAVVLTPAVLATVSLKLLGLR